LVPLGRSISRIQADRADVDEIERPDGTKGHKVVAEGNVIFMRGEERLAGKRLEMSPHHLLNAGFVYSPPRGITAQATVNYVGERFLNKRNTALASSYTTWSAGLGYKLARGEIRVDGRNLNNVRPPVAESELGDAQYYRLPARRIEVTYRTTF